jgi:hypothetical protein
MQKQRKHQPQIRLLPHSFKLIGRGIILLGLIIISITYKTDIGEFNNIRSKVLLDMIIIGCLLMSFAKEKIEDELLMLIRLQSAAYALIFSILLVILLPLVIYIHDGRDFNVPDLAIVILSL